MLQKRNQFGRYTTPYPPLPKAEIKPIEPIEPPKPKIGYKGFNKDLGCMKETFEIGVVYAKDKPNPRPMLCTKDGFHYCEKLEQVFIHYANQNGNRYCEIEILGSSTSDYNKSTTTSFKILREIPQEEIDKLLADLKYEKFKERFGLNLVKTLQTKYPLMQISGSVGLYLHGVKLKRWENSDSNDLDVIFPYYHNIEQSADYEVMDYDEERSGNDFSEAIWIDGKKIDIRIDANQRYEMIELDGFKYRVSKIEHIMEAKVKYMLNGQKKHKEDCYEIFGKPVNKTVVDDTDDIEKLF